MVRSTKNCIKILQTNLNRQRAAHDMAFLTSYRLNIDLIIASEPNKSLMKSSCKWKTDSNLDVAVYFKNNKLEVANIKIETGFVILQLESFDVYCCYSSPNISLDIFKSYVDRIMNSIRNYRREAIVLGDLNIKSPLWGAQRSDARGEYFAEWIAAMQLVVHNTGSVPTFTRGSSASYIDVTCSTERLAGRVRNWKVLEEEETISDHNFIYFEIENQNQTAKKNTERQEIMFNKNIFRKSIGKLKERYMSNENASVTECISYIKQALKESSSNRNGLKQILVPYWWNAEIETYREMCKKTWRSLTRYKAHVNHCAVTLTRMLDEYKVKKKELKRAIKKSKNMHWKNICKELYEDIWGAGYKIVMKHLKRPAMPFSLTSERKAEILDALFPRKSDYWEETPKTITGEAFTPRELNAAIKKVKNGKAPGPDGIPPEAIKEMGICQPDFLLTIFNRLLQAEKFPVEWKVARVVLLQKGGRSMEEASAFRPICLINTMGKLYELLLRERLEAEVEAGGGLSTRQFGFRRGKSTIDAVSAVLGTVKSSPERWCALITVDVRNAFNSAVWSGIIRELRTRCISNYLVNIISDYFKDRMLDMGKVSRIMEMGVPQGSVIGPLLWNILYDGVLRLDLGCEVTVIGFADDLAIVVRSRFRDHLILRADIALRKIDKWLRENGLSLAPEKTEAVILKGTRDTSRVCFNIRNNTITPKKAVMYLGVKIGCHGSFSEHLTTVIEKAERRMAALARILPNIGGPNQRKRAILSGVVHSILLYAAPVWSGILQISCHKIRLERAQRKVLVRVVCAYRTISACAVQVLSGIPPIDIQAEVRTHSLVHKAPTHEAKKIAYERILCEWQRRWDQNDVKGQWTKRLIPNLKPWLECEHRNMDYYTTQAFSGHGSFQVYLHRIGASPVNTCIYCHEIDTVEHTLFTCERWSQCRTAINQTLHCRITAENMVPQMIQCKQKWRLIQGMIRDIMKTKETDRNMLQRHQTQ